jgi:hypothetical protein
LPRCSSLRGAKRRKSLHRASLSTDSVHPGWLLRLPLLLPWRCAERCATDRDVPMHPDVHQHVLRAARHHRRHRAVLHCVDGATEENGGDQTSYGTCRCTQRGGAVCAAYTCDQSVTQYNTVCGDECFSTTTTFGKVKTCTCADTPNINAMQHPYCRTYRCFGFGDGAVKTAEWNCYVPASDISGLAFQRDFCWQFGSDQNSPSVAEVKDCLCTQMSGDSNFCASWFCHNRVSKKWIWWSSILASPLAALLHLWVPFVAESCEPGGVVALWFWVLVTYLLVVLLGGIPSLIANTSALLIAMLIVHRGDITNAFRSRKSSHHAFPTVVDGISLCPTCGGR